MTQKKTTPAKPVEPDQTQVDVSELPDFQHAQLSEALQTERTFTMPGGSEYTFKAPVEWSFRCEQALARGDVVTWARGALKDSGHLDDFLDEPSRDIGRIVQFYVDNGGVSRGEGDSSSNS